MKHDFSYMIKEYAVKFALKAKTSGGFADNGRVAPVVVADPIDREGIVLPLTNKDLQYAANGTYTKQDKKVIVADPIELKSIIIYKSLDYTVQEAADWDDYSDFYVYLCRRGGK